MPKGHGSNRSSQQNRLSILNKDPINRWWNLERRLASNLNNATAQSSDHWQYIARQPKLAPTNPLTARQRIPISRPLITMPTTLPRSFGFAS